jgi:hypothetical protein
VPYGNLVAPVQAAFRVIGIPVSTGSTWQLTSLSRTYLAKISRGAFNFSLAHERSNLDCISYSWILNFSDEIRGASSLFGTAPQGASEQSHDNRGEERDGLNLRRLR